jgi:hypothetical protein
MRSCQEALFRSQWCKLGCTFSVRANSLNHDFRRGASGAERFFEHAVLANARVREGSPSSACKDEDQIESPQVPLKDS